MREWRPLTLMAIGTSANAAIQITGAGLDLGASFPQDCTAGISTLAAAICVILWHHDRRPKTPIEVKVREAEDGLKRTEEAVAKFVDAVESAVAMVLEDEHRWDPGPSPGTTYDGIAHRGFMPTDYFEMYSVCPACGLEAAHHLRPSRVEEGYDAETEKLKYWRADGEHNMRDYEVIRRCLRCEVHWGQNALGVFPPPFCGPFMDKGVRNTLIIANRQAPPPPWERKILDGRSRLAANRSEIEHEHAKLIQMLLESHKHTKEEQESLMADQHDNLPAIPEDRDIVGRGDVILPDPVADARAKTEVRDLDEYRRRDGKRTIDAGGYVVAQKNAAGEWTMPETPTKVVREDGTVAQTSVASDAWAANIAKAQGDQTLDLTAGAPQGWLPSTEARLGLSQAEHDEPTPPTGPDTQRAELVDPRTASIPIYDDLGNEGHAHHNEWATSDPQYAISKADDDPEAARRAEVSAQWDDLDHDRQESELDRLQADLDRKLGR